MLAGTTFDPVEMPAAPVETPAAAPLASARTVRYSSTGSLSEGYPPYNYGQPVASVDATRAPPHNSYGPYGSGFVHHPVTGQPDVEAPQLRLTQHGPAALSALSPHNNTSPAAPTNLPAPGKTHKCTRCEETFPDKESRQAHIKEIHNIWHCTWPGCKRKEPFHRESSYRRHMREIHHVEQTTERQKREEELAASGQQVDPMQAYLQGAGKALPADVRVKGRKRQRDEMPEDVAVLQEENKRLRERLDSMGDELRRERARVEQEVQSAEQAGRAEAAKMYQEHQEELKQLRQGNSDWSTQRDEMKALREKLRAGHEEETRKIHDRRDKNERRLWNLFNPYA